MKSIHSYVSKQAKAGLPIRIRFKFAKETRGQRWKQFKEYELRGDRLVHKFQGREYSYTIERITGFGSDRRKPHHSVYVVKLEGVPKGTGRDVYVGMTGLSVEERFKRHKAGVKAGKKYVTKYGTKLLYELFEDLNPMAWEEAVLIERKISKKLQTLGYNVYGGH